MKAYIFARLLLTALCLSTMVGGVLAPSPALADNNQTANHSFKQLIAFAQATASDNKPATALSYYTLALDAARGDEIRERIALFGIGHMLVWLGRYVASERVYRELLSAHLSPPDHDIALAGLVESLAYQGRPMAAYAVGSAARTTENPELVVATAQAAVAAGWPDKASRLLSENAAVLASLNPNSRVATELRSVQRDVDNDLGPLAILGYSGSGDSDGLRIGTAEAQVGMRAGAATSALVSFGRTTLWQGNWSAIGALASLGASTRFGDHAWLVADVGSESYPGWQTGTYDSSIALRPSDRYGIEAFDSRDVVQTQAALGEHLTTSVLGVDGDTALSPDVTVAGEANRQDFSDGNDRADFSGKIGMAIDDQVGLSGHLHWQSFSDSQPDSIAYFDPPHYSEFEALLTESRRLGGGWQASLSAGVGRQYINPGSASTTASYEGSVSGYGRGCLGGQVGYGYANSALASSSGYQRHYGSISINCLF